MKIVLVTPLLTAVLLTLSHASAQAQSTGDKANVEQIQQLQQRYVASINAADPALVAQVWSHAPEVIFVEPRGTERGLQQVQEFVKGTFGTVFSKRDLQLENPAIHVYGDTAWSEMTWTFHATVRATNQPITTKGRETQILRKEQGTWHLLAVHYSGPAMTAKLQGF